MNEIKWRISRIKWWWIGLFNPFIKIMNTTDRLTVSEMRECADWMKAEADSREDNEAG